MLKYFKLVILLLVALATNSTQVSASDLIENPYQINQSGKVTQKLVKEFHSKNLTILVQDNKGDLKHMGAHLNTKSDKLNIKSSILVNEVLPSPSDTLRTKMMYRRNLTKQGKDGESLIYFGHLKGIGSSLTTLNINKNKKTEELNKDIVKQERTYLTSEIYNFNTGKLVGIYIEDTRAPERTSVLKFELTYLHYLR